MKSMAKVEAELRARGESLAAFAVRIGVRSQDINNWKKRGIPRTKQKLVADAFGWTLDYLLTEEDMGAVTRSRGTQRSRGPLVSEPVIGYPPALDTTNAADRRWVTSDSASIPYVQIPRRRLTLSAENGTLLIEEETPPLAFAKHWVNRSGLRTEDIVVLDARGDSMEPLIHDGDVLLVDLGHRAVREADIFVIRYDHELRVRRLYRRYDGSLILRCDNGSRYPDETIPPADQDQHVQVIGRVLWRGGEI